jgi:hypothetical protein
MTEQEWLECGEPLALLDFLGDRASLRKLRLLACVCSRRLWPAQCNEAHLAIETAERYADGLAKRQELHGIRSPSYGGIRADNCAAEARRPSQGFRRHVRGALVQAMVAASADDDGWVYRTKPKIEAAEKAFQVRAIRDVFGNPFRPVVFDPAWLKWHRGVIRQLAGSAYEQRSLPAGTLEPDRLAILADALEDAGCSDGEILDHLRGPGFHVRGCFLLDLLLGKQ